MEQLPTSALPQQPDQQNPAEGWQKGRAGGEEEEEKEEAEEKEHPFPKSSIST